MSSGNKSVSKELLAAKKNAQEAFLRSVLRNEGNSWSEFYKSVKRQGGNYSCDEDRNGAITTGSTEKANILNSH